ncbi:hypothetical protein RhiJN_15107 [Ceratobasidium sp. AG-Ba]|nr:hypothetical protein RhiJN_15107 [Ceratobasidium sp. AG-Ba]
MPNWSSYFTSQSFDYFLTISNLPLAELSVWEASEGMSYSCATNYRTVGSYNTEPSAGIDFNTNVLRRRFLIGPDIEVSSINDIDTYSIRSVPRGALADAVWSVYSLAIQIIKKVHWWKIIYNESHPIQKPDVFQQLYEHGLINFKPKYDVTNYQNYRTAYTSVGDLLEFVNSTQCWAVCMRNWLAYLSVHEGVYQAQDRTFECPNRIVSTPAPSLPSTPISGSAQVSSDSDSAASSPRYSPKAATYSPEPGEVLSPKPDAAIDDAINIKSWLTGLPAPVPDFDVIFSEINEKDSIAGIPMAEFFGSPLSLSSTNSVEDAIKTELPPSPLSSGSLTQVSDSLSDALKGFLSDEPPSPEVPPSLVQLYHMGQVVDPVDFCQEVWDAYQPSGKDGLVLFCDFFSAQYPDMYPCLVDHLSQITG